MGDKLCINSISSLSPQYLVCCFRCKMHSDLNFKLDHIITFVLPGPLQWTTVFSVVSPEVTTN